MMTPTNTMISSRVMSRHLLNRDRRRGGMLPKWAVAYLFVVSRRYCHKKYCSRLALQFEWDMVGKEGDCSRRLGDCTWLQSRNASK